MTLPTPTEPEHFDWRPIAQEVGLSPQDLTRLIRLYEAEYPDDLLLRELHILRACRAMRDGRTTLHDLLKQAPPSSAA